MPAFGEEVDAALDEGVKIQYLVSSRGSGREQRQSYWTEMHQNGTSAPPTTPARRRPVPVQGSEFVVDVDTIIPAIGQIIDSALWDSVQDLGRTRRNTIYVDPIWSATSIEGVFSGGDAGTGPATVVEAVAEEKQAAESITRFIKGEDIYEGRPWAGVDNPEYPPVPNIRPEARAKSPELAAPDRKGFQPRHVVARASRGERCGRRPAVERPRLQAARQARGFIESARASNRAPLRVRQ